MAKFITVIHEIAAAVERDVSNAVSDEIIVEIAQTLMNTTTTDLTMIPGGKGLYYFECRLLAGETIEKFAKKWMDWKDSNPKLKSPAAYFNRNVQIYDGWFPLYVGKRSDIRHRVEQHISKPGSDGTFGMRLRGRELEDRVRFCAITFPGLSPIQYDIVMPHIEKLVQKKLSPLIGR